MGDGKVRRIAIIINGDNSDKHLGNVERASKLFEDKEYQTHVVSTEKPSTSVDSFTKINQANLSKLLAKLRGKIDDDDEIVIYVTGHGDSKGNGCIEIPGKCLKQNSAQIRRLFNLKYGKRTVIMSQCFSGNWAEKFKNDPNTLFMSAGSKGETVCCEDFDPHLLSNDTKIPDQNNDGTITWKERYQYAISHKQTANTTYIAGTEYKDTGLDGKKTEPARHSGTTHRTSTPAALKSLTKRLKPGEVAVVKVSAPHCPPCVAYKPKFEEMAKADGGKNLFITIPNGDKEFWSKLGEAGYPTVFLIDHTGKTVQVQDRNKPLAERYKLAGIQWKDKEYCLKQIKEAGYD